MFAHSTHQLAATSHTQLLAELEEKGFATNEKWQPFMAAIKNHRYRFALQQLFAVNGDHSDLIKLLLRFHPILNFNLNQLSQTGKTVLDCLARSILDANYKKSLIEIFKKSRAKYNVELPLFQEYRSRAFIPGNESMRMDETLPKKIHVLWLGSDLTPTKLQRLHRLAAKCHQKKFELNIWLTSESQLIKPLSNVAMTFPNIKICLVSDLCDAFKRFCTNDGYLLLMNAMRREMVGSANFATVADFMRIMILILHGGIWFDMDVSAPLLIAAFEEKMDNWQAERQKAIEKANDPKMKDNLENWFGIKAIQILEEDGEHRYNSYIICSVPMHMILFNVLQKMITGYWLLDFYEVTAGKLRLNAMDAKRLRPKSIEKFEDESPRRELTIRLGPSTLMAVMNVWSKAMGPDFILKSGLQRHEMNIKTDGKDYFYECIYVPFFGIVENYSDLSWDVRPPTSFETDMKSIRVPF